MKKVLQSAAVLLFCAVLPTALMAQASETQSTDTGKLSGKDPCNVKYKMEEANMNVKNDNGYLVLQFDFKLSKNSDIPETAELFVKVTNCKGEQQYIKMTVKYDKATGTFAAAQAIPTNKECPLTVDSITLQVKDGCGDTYSWCAKATGGGLKWSGKHIEKGVLMC